MLLILNVVLVTVTAKHFSLILGKDVSTLGLQKILIN